MDNWDDIWEPSARGLTPTEEEQEDSRAKQATSSQKQQGASWLRPEESNANSSSKNVSSSEIDQGSARDRVTSSKSSQTSNRDQATSIASNSTSSNSQNKGNRRDTSKAVGIKGLFQIVVGLTLFVGMLILVGYIVTWIFTNVMGPEPDTDTPTKTLEYEEDSYEQTVEIVDEFLELFD